MLIIFEPAATACEIFTGSSMSVSGIHITDLGFAVLANMTVTQSLMQFANINSTASCL
jgi:hypothetical protein